MRTLRWYFIKDFATRENGVVVIKLLLLRILLLVKHFHIKGGVAYLAHMIYIQFIFWPDGFILDRTHELSTGIWLVYRHDRIGWATHHSLHIRRTMKPSFNIYFHGKQPQLEEYSANSIVVTTIKYNSTSVLSRMPFSAWFRYSPSSLL